MSAVYYSAACPVCGAGEVEMQVEYAPPFAEVEVTYSSCGCELDPSHRAALRNEAIDAVAYGEVDA